MVSKQQLIAWLQQLQVVYAENKAYLTDLDSAIGDADHGTNMARGFGKVAEKLPSLQDKPIGALLKDVGMVLVSSVGGASGPLYGTFFMRAGMALKASNDSLDKEQILLLFNAGLAGVQQRGKAELEDKTMLDALIPAVKALETALEADDDLASALAKATAAAELGMKATIPLIARKGRASYLGERSRDHQDPGATSTYLLFKTAQATWV